MSDKIKVTVVVVDFRKAERVVEQVKSLKKQEVPWGVKIVVVDNSVNGENAKVLERVEVEENVEVIIAEENLGYTRANNVGAKRMEGDFLVISNPDIVWREKDALRKLVEYMEANPKVGVVGPAQKNEDGSRPLIVRKFPKLFLQVARRTGMREWPVVKKWVAEDERQDLDPGVTQEVDWLQSSCVMVRRDAWEKVGGFDERYFLFMSDAEMCWEVWRWGWRVVYFAGCTVWADGRRCSEGGFWAFFYKRTLRIHLWDSIKYAVGHLLEKNPRKKVV